MRNKIVFAALIFMAACSPPVVRTLNSNHPPSHEYPIDEIKIFTVNKQAPPDAIQLGTLKIDNNDLSKYCSYESVIELAKRETKSAGGNILKITEHKKPDFKSSCHRIKAIIYKCDGACNTDSVNKNADYYVGPATDSKTASTGVTPPKTDSIAKNSNRNVKAIGYQIGGWTLIGIEYEVRFHDYFGLNFGAGFRGYTGGVKVHINPKKNSPFFLVSYKDGGFGLIDTYGVEYGERWVFRRRGDFGILCQAGLAKISYIDSNFKKNLYGNSLAPDIIFSFGIGFSF